MLTRTWYNFISFKSKRGVFISFYAVIICYFCVSFYYLYDVCIPVKTTDCFDIMMYFMMWCRDWDHSLIISLAVLVLKFNLNGNILCLVSCISCKTKNSVALTTCWKKVNEKTKCKIYIPVVNRIFTLYWHVWHIFLQKSILIT